MAKKKKKKQKKICKEPCYGLCFYRYGEYYTDTCSSGCAPCPGSGGGKVVPDPGVITMVPCNPKAGRAPDYHAELIGTIDTDCGWIVACRITVKGKKGKKGGTCGCECADEKKAKKKKKGKKK